MSKQQLRGATSLYELELVEGTSTSQPTAGRSNEISEPELSCLSPGKMMI